MPWLRLLRWKLFISHTLIIASGVLVLLPTAHFLAAANFAPEPAASLSPDAAPTDKASVASSAYVQSVVDQALLISAFAALTAAVIVSLFVSRRIVEPLQELTVVSGRLAQGYFRERTAINSNDELGALSQSINQLAEALEKTELRRLGLVADVAHELRTPLTTIEGYMEGLIDSVIKPEPEIFAMIQHEATRLKWMIEEMALLSRAEAGQLRIEPKPIALLEIIKQVAAQFQPQVASQELTLTLDLPPTLPQVLADPDRVVQVLINLLANALQYTPAGGEVTVFARSLDFVVQVGVRDTGIGIAAEHLPHIFERFYRVDKSRARQSGGAGIGLTIARHLVYAHGGEIWVESEGIGRGSVFNFTLPFNEPIAN